MTREWSSKSDKSAGWHLLEFNVGDSFLFGEDCDCGPDVSAGAGVGHWTQVNLSSLARGVESLTHNINSAAKWQTSNFWMGLGCNYN